MSLKFQQQIMTPDGNGYVFGANDCEIYVIFSRSDFESVTWIEKFSRYNGPCVTKVYKLKELDEFWRKQ